MDYLEAADRIEEYAITQFKQDYPHAFKITEALKLAVDILRETAANEKVFEG